MRGVWLFSVPSSDEGWNHPRAVQRSKFSPSPNFRLGEAGCASPDRSLASGADASFGTNQIQVRFSGLSASCILATACAQFCSRDIPPKCKPITDPPLLPRSTTADPELPPSVDASWLNTHAFVSLASTPGAASTRPGASFFTPNFALNRED